MFFLSPFASILSLRIFQDCTLKELDVLHQAVSSEVEHQRPKLEDLRGLGRVLSEGGAAKLVEPHLLPVNKRWAELDVKFTQVRHKSVSLLLMVKKINSGKKKVNIKNA